MAQHRSVIQSALIAMIFTFAGMALCIIKFDIYTPNLGWFISQLYSFLFPFKNKVAANRRNGVVGNTGRKVPAIPRPSDKIPNIVKIYLICS